MRLYNALTRTAERFRPVAGRPVSVYACGITPYDTTHLGHAFTYIVYDVLIRHLEVVHSRDVLYAQNVTDIDDDILRKASEVGEDWRSLADRWTARFVADMRRLNMRPPDAFPAATGYIDEIQNMVTQLVEGGNAYASDGNVYLRTGAGTGFGERLIHASRVELLEIANERGNFPDDPLKADPLDAVLWQASEPGEPYWESPWGRGRPGWHVECAAMATSLLGPTVDVHGGGDDLRFPHHEAEIAVAELATGRSPFVRFWTQVAMVEKDGEKMSKSLGNLVLVDDLLEDEHPDTLRLYLLRHPYRQPWAWNPSELAETRAWTRTLHGAMGRESGSGVPLDPAPYGPRFTAALDDDLNIPSALATVMQAADDILAAPINANVAAAQDVLRALGGRVLGLWLRPDAPEADEAPPWPVPETGAPDGVAG
jgi:L-cysteine:1D-myo-inositol 2-amino-2-deoxy-alpha-D-glucopyranoside ligase